LRLFSAIEGADGPESFTANAGDRVGTRASGSKRGDGATLTGQLQQYQSAWDQLESNTTTHNDLQRQVKEAEDNYQALREEARRVTHR